MESKDPKLSESRGSVNSTTTSTSSNSGPTKYRPPGARGEPTSSASSDIDFNRRREKDENAIRVTNLSEDAREADLQDLFRPFGQIMNIFLAKEKGSRDSARSKGFAFVTFAKKEDAARAIERLNGFGYDHLILKVEWAQK
jgi:translation initiation factor 3 subunit G